jgi:transcriptional regulator with XRE-family HTH domain
MENSMSYKATNESEKSELMRKVYRLRAAGITQEEIATKLKLNVKTVAKYIRYTENTFTTAQFVKYVNDYVKRAIHNKLKRDEVINAILYSGSAKEKIMASKNLDDRDKQMFDMLSKTGDIKTVAEKVEITTDVDEEFIKNKIIALRAGKDSEQN